MSRDFSFLLDIFNAAKAVARFVDGRDEKEFVENEFLQSAVQHQLIVIEGQGVDAGY
jgi:uncharacterized protein with HEPN domain